MADTHLDRDVLSALQEVMEDGYPELLDTFLADAEERLSLLREADDADQVGAAAHSLKGSSSNMGATGWPSCAMTSSSEPSKKASPALKDWWAKLMANSPLSDRCMRPSVSARSPTRMTVCRF